MKKISIALLFLFLFGCVSVGRQIDQSSADKIQQGKSTKEEVVNLVGPPGFVSRLTSGDTIFHYNYTRATPKASSFIPCIGPLLGGSDVQSQSLNVTFGPDGIVKAISRTEGATESNIGIGIGEKPEPPSVK